MEINEILKKIQSSVPTATESSVREVLEVYNLSEEDVNDSLLKDVVRELQSSALKPSQSHQLARSPQLSQHPQQITRSTPKPITRAQRSELERANRIDLKVEETASDRKDTAIERVKFEVEKLDSELDSIESERARDLVDEVIPAFAEWRMKQSPDRIATHIENYGKEVAVSLLPKFRSYSDSLGSELREAAASIIGSFGAA